MANGIPITVIAQKNADSKWAKHSSHPKNISHRMLPNKPPAPKFPISTSRPKGSRVNEAILKHCNPKGIPTTVIQHSSPAKNHMMELINPPNINQNKFPNKLIFFTLLTSDVIISEMMGHCLVTPVIFFLLLVI